MKTQIKKQIDILISFAPRQWRLPCARREVYIAKGVSYGAREQQSGSQDCKIKAKVRTEDCTWPKKIPNVEVDNNVTEAI